MSLDWSQCPAVESIPGKVSGAWVLRGTRTPVKVLFENLEAGMSIEKVLELLQVARGGFARQDLRQQTVHLHRASPAGNAFAARFVHAELHEEARDIHHLRGVIHDDHAARSHNGAELGQGVVIHWRIERLSRDAAARRADRL